VLWLLTVKPLGSDSEGVPLVASVAWQPLAEITVTGRIGTSLRRGGRFIQPAEVEQALRRHPDVTDATVMGRPDADGEDIVEAHVETRTGVPIPVEALRQHLAALLEGYKIPMAWQFYAELPRTSGGKPARTQLTDPTPEA
jgi:acyl-CoA synthetase (AMP-forming)/AMP-acid ligase II